MAKFNAAGYAVYSDNDYEVILSGANNTFTVTNLPLPEPVAGITWLAAFDVSADDANKPKKYRITLKKKRPGLENVKMVVYKGATKKHSSSSKLYFELDAGDPAVGIIK